MFLQGSKVVLRTLKEELKIQLKKEDVSRSFQELWFYNLMNLMNLIYYSEKRLKN